MTRLHVAPAAVDDGVLLATRELELLATPVGLALGADHCSWSSLETIEIRRTPGRSLALAVTGWIDAFTNLSLETIVGDSGKRNVSLVRRPPSAAPIDLVLIAQDAAVVEVVCRGLRRLHAAARVDAVEVQEVQRILLEPEPAD